LAVFSPVGTGSTTASKGRSTIEEVRGRRVQAKYRHPLARGLQALASYTLVKATDNVSNESFTQVSTTLIDPTGDYAPSDFDRYTR
jgi:hypothetical protein